MNRLASHRQRGRARPQVEALEERCVLNAKVFGGLIVTTGSVNGVLITDNGKLIRVFSDNSPLAPLATLPEGTPLTVKTAVATSQNFITYDVLGYQPSMLELLKNPNGPSGSSKAPAIHGNLQVTFGSGLSQLQALVAGVLPDNMLSGGMLEGSNLGDLGDFSALGITAFTGGGPMYVSFASRDIGKSAQVALKDTGGGSFNSFVMSLAGVQNPGSLVNAYFWGGTGPAFASVTDSQNIQSGAWASFSVYGGFGNDMIAVDYSGRLQGTLLAAVGGSSKKPGFPTKSATLSLDFELLAGSSGTLSSTEQGGPGSDTLTDVVHKAAGSSPAVTEKADGGGGLNTGTFTSNVAFVNVQKVTIVQ
jgi:hypothetical protein